MSIFFNIIRAYETVDMNENSTFKTYLKSKLFLLPMLQFILAIFYLISLTLFLVFRPITLSDVEIVTGWTIMFLVVFIPFTIYGAIITKNKYKIKFPIKEISNYSLAAVISSLVVYFVMEYFLSYTLSIWEFLPQLIPLVILGGTTYLTITFLIDSSTKQLFHSLIKEIKRK